MDPNAQLLALAVACSDSDPTRYAFQAQGCYTLDGEPLRRCLAGSVNYANPYVRIGFAHKCEDWLFCSEENRLAREGVYVGAFFAGRHYTFARLGDPGLEPQAECAVFMRWIHANALGLFYPDEPLVRQPAALRFRALRAKRVVPNDRAVSQFLRENPDVL